ncbi:hypothetical protein J6590_053386, partial [Homalodisca vitripennis]
DYREGEGYTTCRTLKYRTKTQDRRRLPLHQHLPTIAFPLSLLQIKRHDTTGNADLDFLVSVRPFLVRGRRVVYTFDFYTVTSLRFISPVRTYRCDIA